MNPLITAAITLTDQVQAAIDAGEWVRAGELEEERRQTLERLAKSSASRAEVTATFATLEERSHRLVGLVQHHRRRVLREASIARSAGAGAAAYAEMVEKDPELTNA